MILGPGSPSRGLEGSLRRGIVLLLLLLSPVASLSLGGCDLVSPRPPPPILLISVDTLRADHLPAYGYPRDTTPELSRHLPDAIVYERAYSAASYTAASVVSMLTGMYPARHGIRGFYKKLSPEVPTLSDLLRGDGYQTAAVVSNAVLTDEAIALARHFDSYDDFVAERELNRQVFQRRASLTTDAALRWLASERDDTRPHFLWIHYIDPHAPYRPPALEFEDHFDHEGRRPIDFEADEGYAVLPGITDALDYVDRYDDEIAYTDREIGRFLAEYARLGLLDEAIVIFTSDHGEILFERKPYFEHSIHIEEPVLRVPLLVQFPGLAGGRVATPVSLIDLVPTLLEWVGIDPADDVQGISLRSPTTERWLLQDSKKQGRVGRAGLVEPSADQEGDVRLRSAIRDGTKWVFATEPDGRVRGGWIIDLAADPEERNPLPWPTESDPIANALQEITKAEVREFDISRRPLTGRMLLEPKEPPALEPHQEEALRALGYVE